MSDKLDADGQVPSGETTDSTTPVSNEVSEQPAEMAADKPVDVEYQTENPSSPPDPDAPAKTRRGPEIIFPKKIRAKLGAKARPMAIGVIVLVVAFLSVGAWAMFGGGKKDQAVARFEAVADPFRLIETVPTDGAKDVLNSTPITMKFNKPVEASAIDGDFFPSPLVEGTYSQGSSENEIVFTPKLPFNESTIVKVMIHGEFKSKNNEILGHDYFFGYTTAIPRNSLSFLNSYDNSISLLSSIPNGQSITFTTYAGEDIDPNGEVTIYKADIAKLEKAFVYGDIDVPASDGIPAYKTFDFLDPITDTKGLEKISSSTGLKDAKVEFKQGPGVYLLVATSKGSQAGATWVVVSDYGLLVHQDDQKIVTVAQKISDQSSVKGDITFYNLKDSINGLFGGTIDGLQTYDLMFSDKADLVTAKIDGQDVVAPLNVLSSLADIRVHEDKSQVLQGTIVTDKPTYKVGETVKFSGFIRTDNDVQYQVPKVKSLKLFTLNKLYGGDAHLNDLSVTADSHGVVSGQFTVTAAAFNAISAGEPNQITINEQTSNRQLGTFAVVNTDPSQNVYNVKFDKADYLSSDSIIAKVTAKNLAGQPLANSTATLNVYSRVYNELDPHGNGISYGYLGELVDDKDATLKFDAQGEATVPINVSKLPAGNSQLVTVKVNKADAKGVNGSGIADVAIHQGDGYLKFGITKTIYNQGDETSIRLYAHKLNGETISNTKVHYSFETDEYDAASQKSTTKTLLTGDVTTDGSGLAEINKKVNVDNDSYIIFKAYISDAFNNKIETSNYLSYFASNQSHVYSHQQMDNLEISGSNGEATVGDKLTLTIHSPFDTTALVTQERGRIYKSEMVNLKAGDNNYSVDVTDNLAPSFSLTFNYFHDGAYFIEGAVFSVTIPKKQANLTATLSKPQYPAGEKPSLLITTKDSSGQALPSSVVVSVADETLFSVKSVVTPNIFLDWYGERETTINTSSSLTGIGSGGGGGCGGDGGGEFYFPANRNGTGLYWNANVRTDANGQLTIALPSTAGNWRVTVYSASDGSVIGNTTASYNVQ